MDLKTAEVAGANDAVLVTTEFKSASLEHLTDPDFLCKPADLSALGAKTSATTGVTQGYLVVDWQKTSYQIDKVTAELSQALETGQVVQFCSDMDQLVAVSKLTNEIFPDGASIYYQWAKYLEDAFGTPIVTHPDKVYAFAPTELNLPMPEKLVVYTGNTITETQSLSQSVQLLAAVSPETAKSLYGINNPALATYSGTPLFSSAILAPQTSDESGQFELPP
jgi:hypothetical protein